MMQRIGVVAIWAGLIAALVGLIVGFTALLQADEATGSWLGWVPVGFALMVLGIAMTQLHKK